MTWLPSRSGKAIDLVDPVAAQVDFRDMAHALANTNRYIGHGDTQVSVALHLLIGLDLCPDDLKAHWLLHDGHEERLGDIARPTLDALAEIASFGHVDGRSTLLWAVREFKLRHDRVIYAAAGLPMPTTLQREAIEAIDLRCLATEHRDFHRPSARSWRHERDGIAPAKRAHRWQSPDKIEDLLWQRFQTHLPALRGKVDASLFEEA